MQIIIIKKLCRTFSVPLLLANGHSISFEKFQAKLVDTEQYSEEDVCTIKDSSTYVMLSKLCGEETYHLQANLVGDQKQIEEEETKAENLKT